MRVAVPRSHVVLYDGACGFCDRMVRFVLPRDPGGTFAFAALQGDFSARALARHGAASGALDTFRLVVDAGTPRERLLDRGRATRFLLARLRGPWPFVSALLAAVPPALLDAAYAAVARSRYRIFGRLDACPAPPPEHVDRFLDSVHSAA